MKYPSLFLLIVVLALCISSQAGVPPLINFQGLLTDTTGAPVTDGNYSVTFGIYDSLSGGNLLWQETQSIATVGGKFTVELGTVQFLDQIIFSEPDRWLGIEVGADPEISPRTRLSSVPHSFKVGTVDGATGGEVTDNLSVSGNVGIGTTAPTAPLTIQPVSGNDIQFAPSGGPNADIIASNQFNVGTNTSSPLHLLTNSSSRIVVNGTGEVGIGTPAPASPLEVFYNNSSPSTPAIAINNTTGLQDVLDFKFGGVTQGRIRMANGGALYLGTVVSNHVNLITNNSARMTVSNLGDVGIGTISPAYKLEVSGPVMLEDLLAPPIFASGHSGIYSSAGQLFAIDESGNTTQLSPHDSETGEWIFYSKNLKTGRVVRIDMERLVRKFEEITGEKFLTEEFEN